MEDGRGVAFIKDNSLRAVLKPWTNVLVRTQILLECAEHHQLSARGYFPPLNPVVHKNIYLVSLQM